MPPRKHRAPCPVLNAVLSAAGPELPAVCADLSQSHGSWSFCTGERKQGAGAEVHKVPGSGSRSQLGPSISISQSPLSSSCGRCAAFPGRGGAREPLEALDSGHHALQGCLTSPFALGLGVLPVPFGFSCFVILFP